MHSQNERSLRQEAIEEVQSEIRALRHCLKEGGHPEDMDSWRHELCICLTKLTKLGA